MKRCVRITIGIFWILMTAWLVRYEAFPAYFTHSLTGYRGLLSKNVLVMDSWMRILFKGEPIGYSHTSLDLDDSNLARRFVIDNCVQMKLKLMGALQSVNVRTVTVLDMAYQLQEFTFSFSSKGYAMSIRAVRSGEEEFEMLMKTGRTTQSRAITIPKDVVLYSPMTEMAMRKLKPGQELAIQTLDPLSLSNIRITVRALRREQLMVGGEPRDTVVLCSEYLKMQILSWIDDNGNLLRQDTPFGWSLEKCSIEEAFAALGASEGAGDMLAGMAVRCKGVIRNPRKARSVKLRLTGASFSKSELASPRQEVLSHEEFKVDLQVRAAQLPQESERKTGIPPAIAKYLKASDFAQADHPNIIARAASIVGDLKDPLQKALAIGDWVDRRIENEITISLPSALDVLNTMKGDCNEHACLFVALARAAGLPAVTKVGLAYHEGKFYYHAWPAVYVGVWLEMDPTWSQKAVDATHIALVEGELGDQMALIKVMGRLHIETLGETP